MTSLHHLGCFRCNFSIKCNFSSGNFYTIVSPYMILILWIIFKNFFHFYLTILHRILCWYRIVYATLPEITFIFKEIYKSWMKLHIWNKHTILGRWILHISFLQKTLFLKHTILDEIKLGKNTKNLKFCQIP